MTTMTDTPVQAPQPGPSMHLLRLLRSERRKMTSTKTWWLYGIAIVVGTGISLLSNIGQTYDELRYGGDGGPDANGNFVRVPPSVAELQGHAANIFTSGQYLGGLFVMLLAILLITNEYYHQTATTTFLATPRRTSVVVSKFLTAMMAAAIVWAFTTVINLIFGAYFFSTQGLDSQLNAWTVQRAILINLLMFVLWGVFGIGIGALLRSQIGATITSALVYTVGAIAALLVFELIHEFIYKHDAVFKGMVIMPSVAAEVASGSLQVPIPEDQAPVWWIGVIVMLVYGAVMATVGTLILRKRDIS